MKGDDELDGPQRCPQMPAHPATNLDDLRPKGAAERRERFPGERPHVSGSLDGFEQPAHDRRSTAYRAKAFKGPSPLSSEATRSIALTLSDSARLRASRTPSKCGK